MLKYSLNERTIAVTIDKNGSTKDFEQSVILFYNRPNSIAATARAFQSTPYKIGYILTKYNIAKHSKETQYDLQTKQRNQTCLEKFGVICSRTNPDVKQKRDATMQLRYSAIYSGQSAELEAKRENTCLKNMAQNMLAKIYAQVEVV